MRHRHLLLFALALVVLAPVCHVRARPTPLSEPFCRRLLESLPEFAEFAARARAADHEPVLRFEPHQPGTAWACAAGEAPASGAPFVLWERFRIVPLYGGIVSVVHPTRKHGVPLHVWRALRAEGRWPSWQAASAAVPHAIP